METSEGERDRDLPVRVHNGESHGVREVRVKKALFEVAEMRRKMRGVCTRERERERDAARKKRSSVIERSLALRLRLRRRAGLPFRKSSSSDTKDALAGGESLLCPRSSFLPSFLSLPNDVFPAIGFLCEQWLGGRPGGEKHEEKGSR